MHGVEWGKIQRLPQRITYHYFREPSPVERPKARTSASSSKRSSELSAVPFMSLDLTPGHGNLLGESYWELISPWLGGAWMLNTGVSPNDARGSSLSQILQDAPPIKYYLSPKACLGILRRASERGKALPPKLERALKIQAGLMCPDGQPTDLNAFHINQRDEGIDLHGVSGALMATTNMQMQTFVAERLADTSMQEVQAAGVVTKGNRECFLMPETHAALTEGGGQAGQGYPCVLTAGFCGNASSEARGIGFQTECSPTITGAAGSSGNNQPVLFENHEIDARYTGPHEVAPTMSARYGTGGNNVPLVADQPENYCISGNIIDRQEKNGGNGFGCQPDISYTLTGMDRHAVFSRQRSDELIENEVVATQSARQHKEATDLVMEVSGVDCRNGNENGDISGTLQPGSGGTSLNSIHPVRMGKRIRRLTPLECERLQGFPDGWTDIPGASDSVRYKALGNSVAIPCVDFVLRGIAYFLRKIREQT